MVGAPTQAIEMVLELHDAVHTSYISELLLGISFCDNKLSTEHSLKSTTGWVHGGQVCNNTYIMHFPK